MKKTLLFLSAFILILLGIASGESYVSFVDEEILWLGKKAEEVEGVLFQDGYAKLETGSNLLSDVLKGYTCDTKEPCQITLWLNSDTGTVVNIINLYNANPEEYDEVVKSFSERWGEPEFTETWDDVQERITMSYPEQLLWEADSCKIVISSNNHDDDTLGTLEDIQNGVTGFSIKLLAGSETQDADVEEIQRSEVSIEAVDIIDDIYRDTQICVVLKNNSSIPVEDVVIQIRPYNENNELVYDKAVNCKYDDILRPGEISLKGQYYSHYSFTGAAYYKIAVAEYQRVDGNTVKIPSTELDWQEYRIESW